MLELVAAALGGASKFASPDLRLGLSRRDPCVAPRTEHAGSNSRVGGFGEVYGFSRVGRAQIHCSSAHSTRMCFMFSFRARFVGGSWSPFATLLLLLHPMLCSCGSSLVQVASRSSYFNRPRRKRI